jgi:hypothetical protein
VPHRYMKCVHHKIRVFYLFCSSRSRSSSSSIYVKIMLLRFNLILVLTPQDTSATNLMMRDERMQMVVQKSDEPITPLCYKVYALYNDLKGR